MSNMRPHPGPRHAVRRFHSVPEQPVHIRAQLDDGYSLHHAVWEVLQASDLKSASMTFISGGFSELKFTTGDSETRADSNKQANFTFIREWQNCSMIYGAATAGLNVEGAPMLHAHAVFADAQGRQFGGHLFPEDCIISHPIFAHIVAHPKAVLQQFYDDETTHTVFNPLTKDNAHVF